ncbi:MAG TPA: FkbM family methyltransferase [Pseudolabrys sp.]|nr:FkbM family methyltransferase [Pseudolabrys sp.]
MDRLYAQFVRPGDLVFDIGAHVGDRVGAFRRLGAQVVAVEPQPALVKVLRLFYGRSEAVRIEPVAVGRRPGVTNLMINSRNPTVSTASQDFIEAARDASGWRDQRWTRTIDVRMMSLDGLIAKHGKPAFIKIDVEGFEAEVLAGLSNPVRALSFEFTTIQRDVGFACIGRCAALGYTKFNGALGETQKLAHESWVDSRSISDWLGALPHEANSGDIYAKLD